MPRTHCRFARKLKKVTAEQGARFVSYDAPSGTWKFEVEHFSKYGLLDSDEEEEEEAAAGSRRGAQQRQQAAAAGPSGGGSESSDEELQQYGVLRGQRRARAGARAAEEEAEVEEEIEIEDDDDAMQDSKLAAQPCAAWLGGNCL